MDSGTQATSRRNHWYFSGPTGLAGGRPGSAEASRRAWEVRASAASAAAEARSGRDCGCKAASASAHAARRPSMPSSSATASSANSLAAPASAAGACARVAGTARSSRMTSVIRASSTPGRSRASKTGPSVWSVQYRGMERTRRMSVSQRTRARAERSRRWSTRSGTASAAGRMRSSSAWNAASCSARRSSAAGSTSGSQPGRRSSRVMSSRLRGCWRARHAQKRVRQLVEFAHAQASFVSRIGRRSFQGQRLRNVTRCLPRTGSRDRPERSYLRKWSRTRCMDETLAA